MPWGELVPAPGPNLAPAVKQAHAIAVNADEAAAARELSEAGNAEDRGRQS